MRVLRNISLFLYVAVSAFAQNVTLESWDFRPDPSDSLTIEELYSSQLAWIDRTSPNFQDVAAEAILGWEAQEVMPRFVLRSGAAIVTTLRFDHYGSDPYGTALVRYASSAEVRPRMEWTR